MIEVKVEKYLLFWNYFCRPVSSRKCWRKDRTAYDPCQMSTVSHLWDWDQLSDFPRLGKITSERGDMTKAILERCLGEKNPLRKEEILV